MATDGSNLNKRKMTTALAPSWRIVYHTRQMEEAVCNSAGIRRYRRFKGWDYAKGASLFITIATEPRRVAFGSVNNGRVSLSPLGKTVAEALAALPRLNPGIRLYGSVVMPDHVHFNCYLSPGLDEPLKVLGNAIRRFKNHTTASAKRSLAVKADQGPERCSGASPDGRGLTGASPDGQGLSGASPDGRGLSGASPDGRGLPSASPDGRGLSGASPDGRVLSGASPDGRTVFGQSRQYHLWQQGYHDYLLVSRQMIDSTERYIAYNPQKWELMYGVADALRIKEPILSPRLDIGDYWKGVGNIALLGAGEKMVSLRVSRDVSSPEAISKVVARMENAVAKGYIIISGFISRGERAVRDMLCRRQDARFVRVLPSCLPNARFRPKSVYVTPFAEKRYLEIARGNDEVEFGRGACLDLNAEIVEIATAGEGLAIYWKATGPQVIARGR